MRDGDDVFFSSCGTTKRCTQQSGTKGRREKKIERDDGGVGREMIEPAREMTALQA